jgi:CspA family cold shock protein
MHPFPEGARVAKRTKGIVRWYDGSKGYGYIQAQDGEDVFVHYSAINGGGLQLLRVGDEVAFFMETSIRGWQATDVTRLN